MQPRATVRGLDEPPSYLLGGASSLYGFVFPSRFFLSLMGCLLFLSSLSSLFGTCFVGADSGLWGIRAGRMRSKWWILTNRVRRGLPGWRHCRARSHPQSTGCSFVHMEQGGLFFFSFLQSLVKYPLSLQLKQALGFFLNCLQMVSNSIGSKQVPYKVLLFDCFQAILALDWVFLL